MSALDGGSKFGTVTTQGSQDDLELTEKERVLMRKILLNMMQWPPETMTWIQDRIAIGGLQIPVTQVLGFTQFVPPIVDVTPFMTAASHTNWNTFLIDASAIYNGVMSSSSAQNDEINFNVALTEGTWDFELIHWKFTDRGIYTVTLTSGSDVIQVGTIDGYNAASVPNTRTTITGTRVLKTATYLLKLKMATKNASSTSYRGLISHIQLRKTA